LNEKKKRKGKSLYAIVFLFKKKSHCIAYELITKANYETKQQKGLSKVETA
jgi:hypothetical protein